MKNTIEMIESSGNVYKDLGMDDAEVMLVKAKLAMKIGEMIEARNLTQENAAKIVGMTQPKLSNMLRGHFRGISESKMMECLNHLGSNIEIVVRNPSPRKALGVTTVIFETIKKPVKAGAFVGRESSTGRFVDTSMKKSAAKTIYVSEITTKKGKVIKAASSHRRVAKEA